ncbi:hypothetical protein [Paracoccus sp. (in: a-proteobacteria)]|uniref:hypothetical protein n=1 Tax=Paracoccus sp. TaxID=267 RepID=UPI002AFFA225|nr:hypothetical protein [Paracoccus sp. (in: a-proteobacteria)]
MNQKATLLLKRYGHQPIFGIKLSEPVDQPNGKPTVLLLNPDFGREGEPNWAQNLSMGGDGAMRVLPGTDWGNRADFSPASLSDADDPQKGACLTIGRDGIHFRAAPGEGFRPNYRHFIHVETLDPAEALGNAPFHLTGYRIFLNQEDWDNGRSPIYQRGI